MATRINPQILEAVLQQQAGLNPDVYTGATPVAPIMTPPPEVFMDMPNAGLGAGIQVPTIRPNPAVAIATALAGQNRR